MSSLPYTPSADGVNRINLSSVIGKHVLSNIIASFNPFQDEFRLEVNQITKRKNSHEYIMNACSEMSKATIEFEHGSSFYIYPLFSSVVCENGFITAEFTQKLKELTPQYLTKFNLLEYYKLKTSYAKKLYKILKPHSNLSEKEVIFTLQTLHQIFETSDKKSYKNFAEFRRRVLLPAVKEIKKNTLLSLSVKVIKESRIKNAPVVAVKFIFS